MITLFQFENFIKYLNKVIFVLPEILFSELTYLVTADIDSVIHTFSNHWGPAISHPLSRL